jgi:hypothetical protein
MTAVADRRFASVLAKSDSDFDRYRTGTHRSVRSNDRSEANGAKQVTVGAEIAVSRGVSWRPSPDHRAQ